MRTVDRVLTFICAVVAVFALSFAVGRIVGPVGPADPDQPGAPPHQAPTMEHMP